MVSAGCTCIKLGWMIQEQETRQSGVSRFPTSSTFIVRPTLDFCIQCIVMLLTILFYFFGSILLTILDTVNKIIYHLQFLINSSLLH